MVVLKLFLDSLKKLELMSFKMIDFCWEFYLRYKWDEYVKKECMKVL